MHQTFYNKTEDCKWLRDTHLKGVTIAFRSFIITGNEDLPDKIETFTHTKPLVTHTPTIFKRIDNQYKAQ